MAFLIVILTHYLTHIFWGSMATAISIVVGVNQVYTCGQDTGCCTTWFLVAIVVLNLARIFTQRLGNCQGFKLLVSQHGLFFFFRKLRGLFFLIKPLALSTTSIYFMDTGKGLKRNLRLGLDSFIKHFVLRVQFSVSTIHLSLDRGFSAFIKTTNEYFLV